MNVFTAVWRVKPKDGCRGARTRAAMAEGTGAAGWKAPTYAVLRAWLKRLVGVDLPESPNEVSADELQVARNRLEQLVDGESAPIDDVVLAVQALVHVDELERSRADARDRVIAAEFETLRALARGLDQLELEELLEEGVARTCESMGFARSFFSFVSRSMWSPHHLFIEPDIDDGGEDLKDALAGAEWELAQAPFESEVVRRQASRMMQKARTNPLAFGSFVEVWRAQSYVVAPVVVRRSVIGLLHADRGGGTLTPGDVGRVDVYAQCLGVALERAWLRRKSRELAAWTSDSLTAASAALVEYAAAASKPSVLEDPEHTVRGGARRSSPLRATAADLSPRELDVARELLYGLTNAEIAKRLAISEGTVKSHVKSILRKLGVRSRMAAVALLSDGSETKQADER